MCLPWEVATYQQQDDAALPGPTLDSEGSRDPPSPGLRTWSWDHVPTCYSQDLVGPAGPPRVCAVWANPGKKHTARDELAYRDKQVHAPVGVEETSISRHPGRRRTGM